MEIIKICSKEGEVMGELGILGNGDINYRIDNNHNLEEIISNAMENGVIDYGSFFDEKTDQMIHKKILLKKNDHAFMSSLSLLLGHLGYYFVEDDSLEEKEIRAILENYPNNNPDKQDILSRIFIMSKLEKTLLLRELKNDNREK
ncbi:MAG: hypothetical protein WA055_02640 [Candidatus Moraniibacteriota bacterium]